ncbi:MAG: hypothetical protein A2Y89_06695 [Chloroflexi bacterium RBG_13_51_18]|nr:MAG: hypothetical protein A2Y89_06695 [Chloroflexi bacterium RBG_13_51_18]
MRTIKITEKFELAHQYPMQNKPQDCYVALDLKNETLSADWNCEIGTAVPMDVYHGHTRRYTIPCLLMDTANFVLEDIAPLAERVIAGYKSMWTGNNNVATLNDDAQQAEGEINKICEETYESADETNTVQICDAEDWLYDSKPYTAGKTDDDLVKMASEFEEQAISENIYLNSDVLPILKTWRDEYAEDEDK